MVRSSHFFIYVLNINVLIQVKTMAHVWIIAAKEENVPSSFMLVGCIGELDNVVFASGCFSLRDCSQLSSEQFILELEFTQLVDVEVTNWVDWLSCDLTIVRFNLEDKIKLVVAINGC